MFEATLSPYSCVKCGASVPEGRYTCPECGAKQPSAAARRYLETGTTQTSFDKNRHSFTSPFHINLNSSDSYLKDEITKTLSKLEQDESGKRWELVLQALVSQVGDMVTASLLQYALYQNRIIIAQNELILRALEFRACERTRGEG